MTKTEALAMADEFMGVEREPNELIREMLQARAGELAALILSVDARARENAALLCDELQEDMADADKCAAAIRAGETALAVNEGES